MPLPGLRRTRPPLRYRPHDRLPDRAHSSVEHEMPMPKTPLTQNLRRLARPTMARRHRRLDITEAGSATPPPRAAEHCSPPCVDPPPPSSSSDKPGTAAPIAHWPCRGAPTPEPRTAPKPSTTNGGTTKPSSKPRQKNLRGTKVKIPEMLAANRISPLDRDPRAATTRHRSDGSDYRVPLISRRANTFQRR